MDRALISALLLTTAYLLDWVLGDPPWFPHPVRLLGLLIGFLEKVARHYFKSQAGLQFAGLLMVIIAAGGTAVLVFFLVEAAYRLHILAGLFAELYFYYAMLAGGDLRHHILRVKTALDDKDLEKARYATSMLVSRDTKNLEEPGLSRAAIESLFENSADGLIAPLFFAALGGPVGIVLYKAVNTLDSMIGYKNEKYLHLGRFAARLDDFLNYFPARFTAIVILAAGLGEKSLCPALKVLKSDRRKHESPNSAWPEAAAAGVLGITLSGNDYYGGKLIKRPAINASGREAAAGDIGRGLSLYYRTSVLAFAGLVFLAWWVRTWEVSCF
jgi:adenosylcobinamide-phosphate synthase